MICTTTLVSMHKTRTDMHRNGIFPHSIMQTAPYIKFFIQNKISSIYVYPSLDADKGDIILKWKITQ